MLDRKLSSLLDSAPKYKTWTVNSFRKIPQLEHLPEATKHSIEVVSHVLPFKTNNYVVDSLIDWNDPTDPLFILNFPQKEMLIPEHFEKMERALKSGNKAEIKTTANEIRWQLNPHPAGQLLNVPRLKDGTKLPGIQHKYEQTVLFFPSQGQTCHAYCSFCYRWPQFVGLSDIKFAMKEADLMVQYIKEHPEVTDVLFTGGDPLIMKAKTLRVYVDALLEANIDHLKTIRFGTKAISYWPYRFISDNDAEDLLNLFRRVVGKGKHVAIMAHFNHCKELQTEVTQLAIQRIRETGAQIRSQSPILQHINDSVEVWATMWQEQISQGCVPYFMFATRDTGAQHYFAVPLARGWNIFREAMGQVSGIGRTLRGFSMSTTPGKIQVVGVGNVFDKKVFVLRLLQARNPEWLHKPFFAEYDEKAIWIDDLKPAFGEKEFFYQNELDGILQELGEGLKEYPEPIQQAGGM